MLDGTVAVGAMQFVQDLAHRDRVVDPKLVYDPLLLARGQVAMTAGYAAAIGLTGFIQPWTDVQLFPKGTPSGQFDLVGYAIALSAPGTRRDAAWEAAKWLTSAEFQKARYKAGLGGVPVRRSVQRSEEYLGGAVPRKWKEVFVRAQERLRRVPPTPKWGDVTAILHPALTSAISEGRPSIRARVLELIPQINAVLRGT